MLLESGVWTKLETQGASPRPRDKLASAVIGEKIYIFGGFGPQGSEENVSGQSLVCLDSTDSVGLESESNLQWLIWFWVVGSRGGW